MFLVILNERFSSYNFAGDLKIVGDAIIPRPGYTGSKFF